MIHRLSYFFFLALLSGCVQSVDRAPHSTVKLLRNNTVAADPLDFDKGQVRPRYQWQLKPGSLIRATLDTTLGIPSIQGQIDGQETRLILDTGNAFPVLLDASSATDIGLPTIRGAALRGTGIGGNVDVLLAQYRSLKILNQNVLGRGVAGVFLHSYRTKFAGMTVNEMQLNLLGLPLLEQFSSLTVDGPRNEVLLAYKRSFQPPSGAASFPFTIQEGRMWIKIKIGSQTVRAFFDTGCGSGLRLSTAALDAIPKSAFSSPHLRKRRAMGVGGIEHEKVGVLREAELGTLRMVPLEFDTSPSSNDILLGWLPFKQTRMTIDFEKKKVWVEPIKVD
ncbi:MAG: Aspartyl protease [Verrucomicrobia bacterium]|nr:MAG: Aspartyl protease [Verrucomicrobiota bacterium]